MTGRRDTLRAWLSLLNTSNAIKKAVDGQLRARFGLSISRFDVMSALQRHPNGLRAGQLSRLLMVTEGNTSQVTAPLVRDGLVERRPSPLDARGIIFSLSSKGEKLFDGMAVEHKEWIHDAFAQLGTRELSDLRTLLEQLDPEVIRPDEGKAKTGKGTSA